MNMQTGRLFVMQSSIYFLISMRGDMVSYTFHAFKILSSYYFQYLVLSDPFLGTEHAEVYI